MACENCGDSSGDQPEPGAPEVTIYAGDRGPRWVAVQWDERGPLHVLSEDGTVTERFTLPSEVAQLPLGGAA